MARITDLTNTTWRLHEKPDFYTIGTSWEKFTVTGTFYGIGSLEQTELEPLPISGIGLNTASYAYSWHIWHKHSRETYPDSGTFCYPNSDGWVAGYITSSYGAKTTIKNITDPLVRLVTITGGVDATNEKLINYLSTNADLIACGTDITASYRGSLLLGVSADQSATIECAGSFMYDDITVKFDVDGNIFYNGKETTVKKGQTATIKCAGLLMRNNVYINAQGIPTMGGNTVIISNGSTLLIETAPVLRASENTIIIGG